MPPLHRVTRGGAAGLGVGSSRPIWRSCFLSSVAGQVRASPAMASRERGMSRAAAHGGGELSCARGRPPPLAPRPPSVACHHRDPCKIRPEGGDWAGQQRRRRALRTTPWRAMHTGERTGAGRATASTRTDLGQSEFAGGRPG
jgi:hypothetical protein